MITFLIVAGLLVAGVLLLVLPPLLGRGRVPPATPVAVDAQQAETALAVLREQLADLEAERVAGTVDEASYQRSREELERRALEEGQTMVPQVRGGAARGWALAVGAGVPVLAVLGYLAVGSPDALDPQKVAGRPAVTAEQIRGMVGTLVARLEKEPDNVEGWSMLARSWLVLENYPEAAKAFARLATLEPGNPDVLADWAEVVATQNDTVAGEAEQLAERALVIAPEHGKALALTGTAAYQRGDYAEAAARWGRILTQVPPGSEIAGQLLAGVNDARGKAGLPLLAAPTAGPMQMPQGGGGPMAGDNGGLTIAGRLELAPELSAQLAPDDAVFVFVRGGAGGPPVAALRFKGSDLPLDFSFDGVQRMNGNAPLPAQLAVAARVSKSGRPMASPGDLEGRVDGLAPDATGVTLRIDTVRQ